MNTVPPEVLMQCLWHALDKIPQGKGNTDPFSPCVNSPAQNGPFLVPVSLNDNKSLFTPPLLLRANRLALFPHEYSWPPPCCSSHEWRYPDGSSVILTSSYCDIKKRGGGGNFEQHVKARVFWNRLGFSFFFFWRLAETLDTLCTQAL